MSTRINLRAIVASAIALGILGLFIGCSASKVDTLSISPGAQSLAVGQTAQFTATGVVGHGQHPSSSENVTGVVNWASSAPAVASIGASGVATAVSPGTTTITASMAGFGGTISSTATVTVTGTTGSAGADIVSVSVIPGAQTVASPNQTSQFIAIGTNTSGATVNVTNQVAWNSSSSAVATIGGSTGLATGVSKGSATISAIYANPDKTVATGTATFTVVGGTSEPITGLALSPSSEMLSVNQSGQLLATGTSGTTGQQQDVTKSSQLTWTSSIPSVASVAAGLVTGVSPGNSTITAQWQNPDGTVVSSTASVTVNTTTAPEPLLSLTIIPNDLTVGNLRATGNFMAIGTFSTPPTVRDLTNSVKWISSFPNYFPVSTNASATNTGAPGGIVTAYGTGTAVIVAEATDPATGSIQTATATFNCPLILPNPPTTAGSCYPGSEANGLLATVTVYNEGLNTTNWLVTAPSATGTQNVIHCGPGWAANGNTGGSVCVATYPINTTLTLTAPVQAGSSFGGWSVNCTPSPNPPTQSGVNQCTLVLTDTNVTIGAIFN